MDGSRGNKPAALLFGAVALITAGAVAGAEKASAIRKEMAKTEEQYFALYNKLNTEKQFDIVCRKEAETGSNFQKRVCKPRYLEKAQQSAAADRLQSVTQASALAAANSRGPDVGVAGGAPALGVPGSLDEGFRSNMLAVLQKSPELQALGRKRDELQLRLAEATR